MLSDPERRASYDRFGHAGLEGSFSNRGFEGFGPFGGFGDIFDAFFGAASQTRRRAPTRGADLQVQARADLRGGGLRHRTRHNDQPHRAVQQAATACGPSRAPSRSAAPPAKAPAKCGACSAASSASSSTSRPATAAAARVWVIPTPCIQCRGTGRERVTRNLEVKVPAGVDNGSQIRLTGEGELGTYGGPRGSLYVVLKVAKHAFFERNEDDLHLRPQHQLRPGCPGRRDRSADSRGHTEDQGRCRYRERPRAHPAQQGHRPPARRRSRRYVRARPGEHAQEAQLRSRRSCSSACRRRWTKRAKTPARTSSKR